MAILSRRLIFSGLGIFSVLLLLTIPRNVLALECFSSPPSVEEGRGVFDGVEPRDLADGEFQSLQELLKSLAGRWTGKADIEVCRDTGDGNVTESEEFSIESKTDFRHSGEFYISSTLSSRQNNTKYQNDIRLCLDRNRLPTVCSMAVSDIELLTATNDKLEYVHKAFSKPARTTTSPELLQTEKWHGRPFYPIQLIYFLDRNSQFWDFSERLGSKRRRIRGRNGWKYQKDFK